MPIDPLIVSVRFDTDFFGMIDGLRRKYFPPERNFIPAHVTLFHALPGEQIDRIRGDIADVCGATPATDCVLDKPFSLGRGVALTLKCDPLAAVRNQLAIRFVDVLSPQDRQPFRPHVTIQNKVTPAAAKETLSEVQRFWSPVTGRVDGLILSHYRGGPWEQIATFEFTARAKSVACSR